MRGQGSCELKQAPEPRELWPTPRGAQWSSRGEGKPRGEVSPGNQIQAQWLEGAGKTPLECPFFCFFLLPDSTSRCGSLPPLGGVQNRTASRKGIRYVRPPARKTPKTTDKNDRLASCPSSSVYFFGLVHNTFAVGTMQVPSLTLCVGVCVCVCFVGLLGGGPTSSVRFMSVAPFPALATERSINNERPQDRISPTPHPLARSPAHAHARMRSLRTRRSRSCATRRSSGM